MAVEAKKYPMMPTGSWKIIRGKFKQSIPVSISSNYLSSSLNMTTSSAVKNIMPTLRIVGLIDGESKTNTELAKKLRDDSSYAEACDEIKKKVYPQELIDAFPDAKSDPGGVKRWFSNHTGLGDSAVGKLVSFYAMLTEADTSITEKSIRSASIRTSVVAS